MTSPTVQQERSRILEEMAHLDHLIRGHERGLGRLEAALAEPKRSVDVFSSLFARKINADLLGMATGESLAHLNCLVGRGRASISYDDKGVAWYKATGLSV